MRFEMLVEFGSRRSESLEDLNTIYGLVDLQDHVIFVIVFSNFGVIVYCVGDGILLVI
jgi:hypothetical protein